MLPGFVANFDRTDGQVRLIKGGWEPIDADLYFCQAEENAYTGTDVDTVTRLYMDSALPGDRIGVAGVWQ